MGVLIDADNGLAASLMQAQGEVLANQACDPGYQDARVLYTHECGPGVICLEGSWSGPDSDGRPFAPTLAFIRDLHGCASCVKPDVREGDDAPVG